MLVNVHLYHSELFSVDNVLRCVVSLLFDWVTSVLMVMFIILANFALSFNVLNPFDCSKSLIIVDTCCNDVTESVKVYTSFIVMA